MSDFWRSIALRLATDPWFFVPYFLVLGGVAIELIRGGATRDRRRRSLAVALYPVLLVLVAVLFLTLKPASAYDLRGEDEAIEHDLEICFGEEIGLVGYTIADATVPAGEAVKLTLYWQSSGRVPVDYHAFVHILGPDGSLVVQGDRAAGGSLPAGYWLPGELIEDEYSLTLPDDVPAGEYSILVGLYDWWHGTRLRAESGTELVQDDAVLLSEPIQVVEQ